MKVIHHASSNESNGNPLGELIPYIIPFLGLSFPEGSSAEGGIAFVRRATPIEINNQIVHILYNLCSLNPARALVAAQNGLVPIIVKYNTEHQDKFESPDEINNILGNYDILTIAATAKTAETGVYEGALSGMPMQFVYDKKTTETVGEAHTYFFRFYSSPIPMMPDTCFINSIGGFYNGLVKFSLGSGNKWYAFNIDSFTSHAKVDS